MSPKIWNKYKKNYPITLILISYILINLILFSQKNIWWDSAVYIGMGKYIFSFGNAGLWEASRPLILPFILGFIWKVGLSPIIFGKILELLFGVGCIYFTYLVGREIFNYRTGLLASVFVGFTPTFFSASSQLMTGIPSTFFGLTGFYLFIKKRYLYSGLLLGIAFLTRFLQLFIFIFLIIFLIYISKREKLIKNVALIVTGFFIPVIPYLILNLLLYYNPIYPFILQVFMTRYTGWPWFELLSFYFIHLFKQNFFVIFALLGTYLIIKDKNRTRICVLALFLIFFIFYNSVIHKEIRFAIVFFPYLYLITSYGIFYIINRIKNKKLALVILFLGVFFWLLNVTPQFKVYTFNENYLPYFKYLESVDVSEGIWITNPLYIVESDKKAELIYYPTFDTKRAKEMQKLILKAKHVLFNHCDILCPPWDNRCPAEKEKFISILKNSFQEVYNKKSGECEYNIFTSS